MRIIQKAEVDGSVVLRLEGSLRDHWVEALRRLSSDILQRPATRLALDLAEVSFVDGDGLELLRELASRQVSVSDCSLFVRQQLQALEAKQ